MQTRLLLCARCKRLAQFLRFLCHLLWCSDHTILIKIAQLLPSAYCNKLCTANATMCVHTHMDMESIAAEMAASHVSEWALWAVSDRFACNGKDILQMTKIAHAAEFAGHALCIQSECLHKVEVTHR